MRPVNVFIVIFYAFAHFHISIGDFASDIKYYVYTRENYVNAELVAPDVESVIRSVLDPLKPITFSIGNYTHNKNSAFHRQIVTTKLKVSDCNVINVDLTALKLNNYTAAVEAAPSIGVAIGDFVILLHQFFDVNLVKFHLVGFGLGAHIAGFAGQQVQKELNGVKLPLITGLDPAAAFYADANNSVAHLTATDAEFVEIVHTNAKGLGYELPIGHADYYPNGGDTQPGCEMHNMSCSHERAYQLVAEMWSLEDNNFLVTKCSNINDMSLENCPWTYVEMGQNRDHSGIFYLETNDKYPYSKGSFMVTFF